MDWLSDCPFLVERFDSLGEAWADAAEYTREISPRMEAQQLRALRMVFYAAASGALEAAPKSCSYDHFEAMMETRWMVFTHGYVLPYLRPLTRPVFLPEAAVRRNVCDRRASAWLLASRRTGGAVVSTRRLRFSDA
jgi:hypothetical protein